MSNAEAMRVIEWATVKAVTTATSGRSRRNGITRQNRNSRWSMPSRMWKKPSLVKRSAAWCQRGSSSTMPGSPCTSKARSALPGVMQPHHDVDPQAEPGQPRADGEARLVGLDVVGEGARRAARPASRASVSSGSGGPARLACASSKLANDLSEGSETRAAVTRGRPSGWPFSKSSTKSPIHSMAASSSVGPDPGQVEEAVLARPARRRRASP